MNMREKKSTGERKHTADESAGPEQAEIRNLWKTENGQPLLPDEQPVSTVRDSLYDLIPLGSRELKIIGSAPFLRLQQIKQLGFVYRIWPGATHTRYEHSLGTYYLMMRGLRALLLRGENGGLAGIAPDSIRAMLLAALLHDIGHYPFSHTIEELGAPIILHERVGREIIEKSEIAEILEHDYRLSPERVADLIDPPRNKTLPPDDELLSSLLSGALDVDKLDYLPRDARACNVPYGGVDMPRLQAALRVYKHPNEQPRLVVTQKGISPLHSLLHARQEMFDNIYWHHTSRAFQMMLLRAVYDALHNDQKKLDVERLKGLDDASLLALLADPAMPKSTQALTEALRLRRPYKAILEISHQIGRLYNRLDALFWDARRRRQIETALASELSALLASDIAEYEVLLDIPRPEKWEMDVWVTFGQYPPVGLRELMSWVEATGLQPTDLATYEQHRRRIRVLVAGHLREKLRSRQGEVLQKLEELIET